MPDPDYLVPRGVHRAPCLSPDGYLVLYAVTRRHCLLREGGWMYVPPGDNPHPANDLLWERLDREDPEPVTGPQSASDAA